MTHFAPRVALAAATIVISCTLALPAAAQHRETGDGLSAPTPTRDFATTHTAHTRETGRPATNDGQLLVRVLAESGVEVLTLGATIATPALIAGLSARNCTGELVCIGPETWAIFFGAIGAILGEALVPPLIAAVGSALGGRGDVGAAYLGVLVGAAIGAAALAGGVAMNDSGALTAMSVLAITAALAGPIVGYEISSANARVTPSVAPIPGGAQVGVAGTFE